MSDTQGQSTSTQGQTTNTQGQTTNTQGQSTSTQGQTTSTQGQTYKSQIINDIESLINDVKNMFPNITPIQLTDLLNSGVDIGKLLNKNNQNVSCNKSETELNSRGIQLQNSKGPSTNIMQINFKGTSNLYSPYLYYNKATTEKFISTNKSTNK